jgi:hypothetical protein
MPEHLSLFLSVAVKAREIKAISEAAVKTQRGSLRETGGKQQKKGRAQS